MNKEMGSQKYCSVCRCRIDNGEYCHICLAKKKEVLETVNAIIIDEIKADIADEKNKATQALEIVKDDKEVN